MVLRVAWTFNFDFAHYEMAGVIWALGWCMVLLAGLIRLPLPAVGTFGIVIVAGHNLLDSYVRGLVPNLGNTPTDALWKIFYVGFFAGPVQFAAAQGPSGDGGPSLFVLYSIIPWIGVMAAGYAFGKILGLEAARRDRLCLAWGLGAIGLFLLLRGFNIYGDPRPWGGGPMPGFLSFLNTTKYPASLSFLLMTLGPCIALMPLLERVRGPVARFVSLFGRVPFFYYVLHIPLIHALALVVSALRQGSVSPWLFLNHPMGNPPPPDGYTWSLPLLYAVFAVAIAILYFACTWFADVKARRTEWWLKYL
jgi:uncharacterized membrane protein